MRAGFKSESYKPMRSETCIFVTNNEIFNTILNMPCRSIPENIAFLIIGVWQPKGTKLKRDAEKL